MKCPHTHLWYELERGELPREEADSLRRHATECEACRSRSDSIREVAAGLEQLAAGQRHDLLDDGQESVLRRARLRGLVGRPPRLPLIVRMQRTRWFKVVVPGVMTAAAAALLVVGLVFFKDTGAETKGSLLQLVNSTAKLERPEQFLALAKVADAAVSEELARPSPSPQQVGDLLLVAYIAQHPKERRQADDIRFLVEGAWSRRLAAGLQTASAGPQPMVASVAVAQAGLATTADPLAEARRHVLSGNYEKALAALPADDSAAVLRAWCLESEGKLAEAAKELAAVEGRTDSGLARLVRADIALRSRDLAEALKQYESLAETNDRFWFTAGYLCRYELADARAAGKRFEKIKDRSIAAYVAKNFQPELAAAKEKSPRPILTEDFESYELGPLTTWTLVMTRGKEFSVVDVAPHGHALAQDEVDFRGAEFLTGDPDLTDYTLQVDVKIVASHGPYTVGAAAYRRSDRSGYVLELSPSGLRLVKQFATRERGKQSGVGAAEQMVLAPVQGQVRLDQPPAFGWWYTLKIRVQKVDGGVSVAGKLWRTDDQEPLAWQVVWTDSGQGELAPLFGGAAGVQISGAKVQIDNFIIFENDPTRQPIKDIQ
jgi:tetratricopeptide (TPR) repeat protein